METNTETTGGNEVVHMYMQLIALCEMSRTAEREWHELCVSQLENETTTPAQDLEERTPLYQRAMQLRTDIHREMARFESETGYTVRGYERAASLAALHIPAKSWIKE